MENIKVYDMKDDSLQGFRDLGRVGKDVRVAKGISRKELSRLASGEISVAWIQKFENHNFLQGKSNFQWEKVFLYFDVLNISNFISLSLEINHNEPTKQLIER